ncbi:MAG: hypothetical protein ACYCRD_07395 [Leptospirillum sp.]
MERIPPGSFQKRLAWADLLFAWIGLSSGIETSATSTDRRGQNLDARVRSFPPGMIFLQGLLSLQK